MFSKIVDFFRDPRVAIPAVTGLGVVIATAGTWFVWRSWMIAISVALALALIVLIVILLRTLRSGEREERLASGLDERDRASGAASNSGRAGGRGVRAIFSQAVSEIRRSRMGDRGIHELPWWITLGPGGSGKTELIRNAGLDVPPEFAHSLRQGPTAGCNFILSNQAVVIDTEGAFVDAGEGENEDWLTLLKLLAKQRPECPLEGVLITLSAVELLEGAPQALEETARTLRRRLNEMDDTLGFDVPVYVIITKTDRIHGFAELATSLRAERLREAVGWTNDRREISDAEETTRRNLAAAFEPLQRMLPELLMREPDPGRRRRLFLFPQELEALCARVTDAIRVTFAPSAYVRPPFLRGVYFTSSMREGDVLSAVAARLGHGWAAREAQSSSAAGGISTWDLFNEIIAGDAELALPTAGLGRRTRNVVIGLAAAASITCLVFGGISFVGNYTWIDELEARTERLLDAPSSIDAADALRATIVEASADDAALAVPTLGRTRTRAVERATESFVWAVDREHIRPTKERVKGVLRRSDHDAFEALAVLAMDVSWLATEADPEKAFRPNLAQYTIFDGSDADRRAFGESYDAYVRWVPDAMRKRLIKDERDAVLSAATSLLDLRRLEEWSERQGERQPPVRYSDFGIDTPGPGQASEVLGAYTRKGWESLVRDLLKAVEDAGGTSEEDIARFRSGYVDRFDRSWRDFLLSTPLEPEPSAAVFESPHLALFERIAHEVAVDLPRAGRAPEWMPLAVELRREPEPSAEPSEDGKPPPPTPWERYRKALDQIAADASTQSKDQALKLARRMGTDSTFTDAISLLEELIPPRSDTVESRKLRELLMMPILDAGASVLAASFSELDQRWHDEVAKPFGDRLDGTDLVSLYDPEKGALDTYLRDELGPFLDRDELSPVIGDLTLPLSSEFFSWLRSARTLQSALFPKAGGAPQIPIRLEGIPSRVINRSDLFVIRRDLRIECATSVETLQYNEGGVPMGMVWRPDCQQVSLRIWVRSPGQPDRELQPRKEWNGPLALPRFFQQAAAVGSDRLRWNLEYEGVEVSIEYRLRAGRSILDLAHRAPPSRLGGSNEES